MLHDSSEPGNLVWPRSDSFDMQSLADSGWKPTPIREFVLKIQSRCNLDCSYCYIYHLADSSWRSQPKRMTNDVLLAIGHRIREHAVGNKIERVYIRLHGGEPLLSGPAYLESVVETLSSQLQPLDVRFTIQTNGVLLDRKALEFFVSRKIRIGISIDGPRETNDLNRVFLNGRSSFDSVEASLKMMLEEPNRDLLDGILCTIQLKSDPLAVFDYFANLGVPWIDLLLPHGTWDSPPPQVLPARTNTPYADWLIPIFDRWFQASERPMNIRMFDDLLNLILGNKNSYEGFGLAPMSFLIVETDGHFEQVDSLKAAFEGAAKTGLSIYHNSVDEAITHPGIVARQIGKVALSNTCQQCRLLTTCGGGHYAHRYSSERGFLNPSVYCSDLYKLISHIEAAVEDALTKRGLDLTSIRSSAHLIESQQGLAEDEE